MSSDILIIFPFWYIYVSISEHFYVNPCLCCLIINVCIAWSLQAVPELILMFGVCFNMKSCWVAKTRHPKKSSWLGKAILWIKMEKKNTDRQLNASSCQGEALNC